MPRFYLHLCNANGFVEDEEGTIYPDLEAVRQAAIDGLRDTLAEEICRGELNVTSFIKIEDERHRHLGTIKFGDAVTVSAEKCFDPR